MKREQCYRCYQIAYPVIWKEDYQLCIDCFIKYDIMESIEKFLYKFKNIIRIVHAKPKKCSKCNKKEYVDNKGKIDKSFKHKQCWSCKLLFCHNHIREIHLRLDDVSYVYTKDKIGRLTARGFVCEECCNSIPELIYGGMYRTFTELLEDIIKEAKEKRSKKRIEKRVKNNQSSKMKVNMEDSK